MERTKDAALFFPGQVRIAGEFTSADFLLRCRWSSTYLLTNFAFAFHLQQEEAERSTTDTSSSSQLRSPSLSSSLKLCRLLGEFLSISSFSSQTYLTQLCLFDRTLLRIPTRREEVRSRRAPRAPRRVLFNSLEVLLHWVRTPLFRRLGVHSLLLYTFYLALLTLHDLSRFHGFFFVAPLISLVRSSRIDVPLFCKDIKIFVPPTSKSARRNPNEEKLLV